MRGREGGRARGTDEQGTGMQVITSKETEIEDLREQLAEATDIIKSRDDTISARGAQIASLQNDLDDLREQLSEANGKAEADLRKSKVCVCMVRHGGAIVGLEQCLPWTGTGSTTRASVLTHTCMRTNQADLEKTENDLAESKKVRALAGRGTASKTQKILAGQ